MYEDKKKKALATLDKKQVKVDEINKVWSSGVCVCVWVGEHRADG